VRPVTKQGTIDFAQGDAKENRGNSNFHALQTSLHRRVGRGLKLGVEYMWSHAISDAAGSGESEQPQNVFNLRGERGNTEFDVRHTMTANYVWELPFGNNAFFGGWQLSGITYARTGRTVNVTISRSAGLLPRAIRPAGRFSRNGDLQQRGRPVSGGQSVLRAKPLPALG